MSKRRKRQRKKSPANRRKRSSVKTRNYLTPKEDKPTRECTKLRKYSSRGWKATSTLLALIATLIAIGTGGSSILSSVTVEVPDEMAGDTIFHVPFTLRNDGYFNIYDIECTTYYVNMNYDDIENGLKDLTVLHSIVATDRPIPLLTIGESTTISYDAANKYCRI